MLIFNADITLDANGRGEADLYGLTDVAAVTVDLVAVEQFNDQRGMGKQSRPAHGGAGIADIAKPDGTRQARLYIDNGDPGTVVRALVEQR